MSKRKIIAAAKRRGLSVVHASWEWTIGGGERYPQWAVEFGPEIDELFGEHEDQFFEDTAQALEWIAQLEPAESTMELGGADAFVVLADADLDKAVDWAVMGRHWNSGQVCCSSKRIIVVDEIYEAFLAKYKQGVAKLKAGDPMDPATTLAPLSSQGAVDDLKAQLDKAVAHGGMLEVIGAEVPTTGAFVQPVLLSMAEDNPAYRMEFFGPVSQVIRARDETDAIRIANDSPFGLGGSVFTQDVAHGIEVAKKISTGMVYINHPTGVAADLPFGGVRRSGYGRELVGLGIKEFVNHKLIAVTDIDGAF